MVAGVAATLMSAYPNISMNELKARLLASAAPIPAPDAALYGNVNLKRALEAQAQPIYLPDFKQTGEVVVDEKSLSINGQVSFTDLWLPSSGVTAQVTINGKPAGSMSVDSVESGQTVTIPWQYTFGSLEESSNLQLNLVIQDKNGTSKNFTTDLSAERAVLGMSSTKIVAIPPTSDGTPPNWLLTENNYNFLNINKVYSYGDQTGLPVYYLQPTDNLGRPLLNANKAPLLELFDPSKAPNPIVLLNIPGVYSITQVIKMDANRDGHMDWVIVGIDQNRTYVQFLFLNENFQALWGTPDASTWRTAASNFSTMMIYQDYNAQPPQRPHTPRSFATAGTWIQAPGGKLAPCFFANGPLPNYDNWDELDPRYVGSDNHLYCLLPQAISNGVTPLQIHALDNKDVRTKFPKIALRNELPQSLDDMKQGRAKVLFTLGGQMNAPTYLWNLDTTASTNYPQVSGWDTLAAIGTPYTSISSLSTENSAAFMNYFDTERGSIAWSTPDGQYVDRSEFSFFSSENPIQNTTGILISRT